MSNARLLPCSCGRKVPVRPSQAGQTVRCSCGAELQVPAWREIAALEPASAKAAPAGAGPWGWPERLLLLGVAGLAVAVAICAYLLVTRPIQPSVADLRRRFEEYSPAAARRAWRTMVDWGLDPWAEDPDWDRAVARFRLAMAGTALLAACAFALVVVGYHMRSTRQRRPRRARKPARAAFGWFAGLGWGLVGIGLCAGSVAQATQPEQETREVFVCRFETPDWYRAWGASRQPERSELVAADPERKFEPLRGRALRIKVEANGHYGLSLAYHFGRQLGREPEEIYFRYYLRLADDWNPRQGGKLPGIAGTYGRAGWGGRPSDGRNGWSARGLFLGQREGLTPVGFYCYHADMQGIYGSHWVWENDRLGYLANNRWYCIEQYARMNTPGKNDGVLRAWVDGRRAFEKTDLRMRNTLELKIESVWINVYLGGSWTAQSDHHLYIDEVAISRAYIGPLAGK